MLLDTPTVLGREEELAALRRFVDDVPRGPRALVLEGEAGIGKTTLWTACVSLARESSFRVLTSRPAESEARLSYAALADLFEGAIAEVTGELPEPQRRALDVALLRVEPGGVPADHRSVSAATLGILRSLSSSGPVLIAVDDEQWIDAPSAAALGFAVRRLREESVGILGASRVGEGTVDPIGLTRAMPEVPLRRIRVEPMSIEAVEALFADRLGFHLSRSLLRRVHDASGGNPFFALELARAVQQMGGELGPGEKFPAPEGLRDLVRARVAELPSSVQEVLLTAAVMARPTVSLAEAAATRPKGVATALGRAARAGVIEVLGEEIRFTHPLFASAVYSESSDRERHEAHRRLADVVADPEERARHLALSASEPDADVAASLEKAAQLAYERGAPAAAAELCELALDLMPFDRIDDRRRLQLTAADRRFLAGDQAAATALLGSVVASSAPGADRAEALVHLGRVRMEDDLVEATRLLTEALEQEGAVPGILAQALTHLAEVDLKLGHLHESERHARLALELAEEAGDPLLIADALAIRAFPDAFLGHGIDHDALERAERLAGTAPRFRVDWDPREAVAELFVVFDRLDEAREIFVELLEIATERGDEPSASYIRSHWARLEFRAGDWGQVLRLSNALDLLGTARLAGLLVGAHQGELEATRSEAEQILASWNRSGHIGPTLESLAVLGTVELLRGNPVGAQDHLGRAWELLRETGAEEPNKAPFAPDEIEVLIQLGELERAEEILAWLEDRGQALDRPRALATGARCRGLLLAAHGDLDGALASLDRAVKEHERLPDPFELGRTLLVAGSLRRRAKQKRSAREALAQALEIFERLGAVPWARRTRAELAAIGGRPAATGELTPTELRVAQLATAGRTNREIAATLFLSVRTVETHLSRAYQKLGVRSRTELAPFFDDQEVRTP